MNEMLQGIRVLKFYAWEDHFTERINHLREKELKSLKGRKYLDALCVYFWATTPVLISILTFTTYVLLGHQLTAAKVLLSYLMLLEDFFKNINRSYLDTYRILSNARILKHVI